MSRMYRANVSITKPKSGRETAIAEALMDFWGFQEVEATEDGLISEAENTLGGGITEKEFSHELAQHVWEANQGFCEVFVRMTYLEELPYEEYFASEDDYDEWTKSTADAKG